MSPCVDPVVGAILAGWRYDISGLAQEMRVDYEQHFAECENCRQWRKIHRAIDIGLIGLASISAFIFLLAFAVIHHFDPRYAIYLEIAALFGFLASALIWIGVAVATPAPMMVADAAKIAALHIHDRLPSQVRDRIPEQVRAKLI